jgi:hypothetical protein
VRTCRRSWLNNWICTSKAYDAFFDFDAATRDPNKPSKGRPEFYPGDHLHLTPAGYEATANAIDLKPFGASGSEGGTKASRNNSALAPLWVARTAQFPNVPAGIAKPFATSEEQSRARSYFFPSGTCAWEGAWPAHPVGPWPP